MPSSSWLLPYDTVWPKDEVIAYTPKFNYTIKDYKRFFQVSLTLLDINFGIQTNFVMNTIFLSSRFNVEHPKYMILN